MNKKGGYKLRENLFQVGLVVFLSFLAFLQILPFYLKFVESLNGHNVFPDNYLHLLPQEPTLENYALALTKGGLFRAFINSIIHTVSFSILSLIIALVVGYVLGKLEFKGKKVVRFLLLSTMMIPGEVLMISNYKLVQEIGWFDSLAGIILPGIVNVFGIFLVQQYMSNIPNSVLESAEIDGCNELQKIFKIVLPMSKPIIITYLIMTFTSTWNEYLWPSLILNRPELYTLQITMMDFYPMLGSNIDGYVRAAGVILITLPIIIMYIIFQRYFLDQGNTSGLK